MHSNSDHFSVVKENKNPPVQMKKRNVTYIATNYLVSGLTYFSCYIELYEVCHPPVQMKNAAYIVTKLCSKRVNLLFMLHRTV